MPYISRERQEESGGISLKSLPVLRLRLEPCAAAGVALVEHFALPALPPSPSCVPKFHPFTADHRLQ